MILICAGHDQICVNDSEQPGVADHDRAVAVDFECISPTEISKFGRCCGSCRQTPSDPAI